MERKDKRRELLNSAGEFINVRIRISVASFTRQSSAMRSVPRDETEKTDTRIRFIGADFILTGRIFVRPEDNLLHEFEDHFNYPYGSCFLR